MAAVSLTIVHTLWPMQVSQHCGDTLTDKKLAESRQFNDVRHYGIEVRTVLLDKRIEKLNGVLGVRHGVWPYVGRGGGFNRGRATGDQLRANRYGQRNARKLLLAGNGNKAL